MGAKAPSPMPKEAVKPPPPPPPPPKKGGLLMPAEKLLYVHAVADILNCSRSYVYLLIDHGHLEAVKSGSYLRVRESSVTAWIESHKYNPDDKYALK